MTTEPKHELSSAPGPGDERPERDRCPVCGEPLGHRGELIRAWPGQFAHDGCASYSRRPRG